jgi:phosphatidylserine decarboxylase
MDLAPGAYRWASIPVVVGGGAGLLYRPAALVGLLAGAAVLLFFRDPERHPDDEGVLAPADGRVTVVREDDGRVRVGVFMNVTDVHVNRAPVAGTVDAVDHKPGGHWPAFTKASERNERRRYRLSGGSGDLEVVQIAGALARRTHSYVETGEALDRGQRLGHIAFGSRVDVLLPPEYDPEDLLVGVGDQGRAGETVLAPTEPDG